MQSRTVQVPNISCGHCVMTIQRELEDVEGVTAVLVAQEAREVTVRWDETRTSWDNLRRVLEEIHYPPRD